MDYGTGTLEYWETMLHLAIYICLVLLAKCLIHMAGPPPEDEDRY